MPGSAHTVDAHQYDFEQFVARFHSLFRRTEPREQMTRYIKALLSPIQRKNSWQIAQAIGDTLPDSTQRLLYLSRWEADEARDLLREFIVECFAHPDGIAIVGDVGFLKKGDASIGVQRQRNPSTGRHENCQIATFLTYATPGKHLLVDRRLYLPQSWMHNPDRLATVKAPANIAGQSRSHHAAEMVAAVHSLHLPVRWVAGRLFCDDDATLRHALYCRRQRFLLATSEETVVHSEDINASLAVAELTDLLPTSRWQSLTLAADTIIPSIDRVRYQWARTRIIDYDKTGAARLGWLVARRALDDPSNTTYFLSNAAATTPARTLARLTLADHAFRCCIKHARNIAGLDEYEVRHWHSWHRHITLSMIAMTWLQSIHSSSLFRENYREIS